MTVRQPAENSAEFEREWLPSAERIAGEAARCVAH